jgi:hypothetical protein
MKMDNIQEAEIVPMTPLPKTQSKALTMSFPDAMKKIIEGKMVTRVSWGNKDYCLLKDGWLTIFTKGNFYTWQVNDGDMEGQDWIVITELN